MAEGGEGMTKQEAISLAKTGRWKTKTSEEIVSFQLYEDKLCMDFSDFHKAVEVVLGRPVFTTEFANPESLKNEFQSLVRG